MQLQVECNDRVGKHQVCWTCDRIFKMQAAQVILCDEQGENCGNVCPTCISRGYGWLNSQFEQLTTSQPTSGTATLTPVTGTPVTGIDRAIAHTKSA
jgi:hypothetical protein